MVDLDERLMQAAGRGDEEVFRTLSRRHRQRVERFARRYVGDADLARDLAQETLIRLWQGARTYAAGGCFRSFLYTIVRNVCRSHARQNGSLVALDMPALPAQEIEDLCAGLVSEADREVLAQAGDLDITVPVEGVGVLFQPKRSLVTVREIGRDVPSFAQAARYALRHDPDVIHLAKLRDLDTVALAMILAGTGHLVLTTMHTASAEESINRIIDVFSPERTAAIRRQLADVLCAVICQRLVLRADGSGRVPACEVLVATPEVRRMIREGTPGLTNVIERSGDAGMQTMEQALARAGQQGLIATDRP